MFIESLLFVLGISALVIGGNWLVDGASTIARWLKVPAMIIGLTIVSVGTSAPELVVNIQSALSGSTELAIGNVIGSNIANILLILGIAGIITPIKLSKDTRVKDIPYSILGSVIIWLFVSDTFLDGSTINILSRIESLTLLGFFIIFFFSMYFSAVSGGKKNDDSVAKLSRKEILKAFSLVPIGIIFLAIGGDMVVKSATNIATFLGVSERIIGLTIVAVGTSLPELVTTVISAVKGKIDILVGNIIGSNIFNIFFILGVTGVIKPLVVEKVPFIDFAFMTGAVLLLFSSLYVGKKHFIKRIEGVIMVSCYVIYIYLIGFSGISF